MTKEYMEEKVDELIERSPLLVAKFMLREIEQQESELAEEDDDLIWCLDDEEDWDESEEELFRSEDVFLRLVLWMKENGVKVEWKIEH